MPFWGEEHLQTFVNTTLTDIFIVESEKTAIYCQIALQRALYLGCNGANGCTRSKIERVKHLLSEKRVFVLFDKDDGGECAPKAVTNFQDCGIRAYAMSMAEMFPDAPVGSDVADVIIERSGVTL